jgi:2-alkenal reductase
MKRTLPILMFVVILLSSALACTLNPTAITRTVVATVVSTVEVKIPQGSQQLPATPTAAPVVISNATNQDAVLTALYQKVNPGVVSIQVVTAQGGGQGSGFVYDKEGHIITNYHVVDQETDMEVDFPSGIKVPGTVVGTDTDSDIAVIKVDVPADQLDPLPLGSGEAVQVGQTVVAIGNPFGLSGTMTVGIVSAKGRTLESIRSTATGQPFSAGAIIQTDAAINPGNSGGPLLNLAGQVIGVNRAIINNNPTGGEATNAGIGFAVNVDILKRVIPALIKDGKYDYPYLGVTSQEDISLAMQKLLKLPQATGAYILEVTPGSPADKAGLRAGSTTTDVQGLNAGGDLIVAVDGREVRVFGDLLTYLMTSKSPGDSVVITIIRNGEKKEVTLTLGSRP